MAFVTDSDGLPCLPPQGVAVTTELIRRRQDEEDAQG